MHILIIHSDNPSDKSQAKKMATWIEEEGHKPQYSSDPIIFQPGYYAFQSLINATKAAQGAVILFGATSESVLPNEHILILYGVAVGSLGVDKAAICQYGSSTVAQTLQELNLISISANPDDADAAAQRRIEHWLRRLSQQELTKKQEEPRQVTLNDLSKEDVLVLKLALRRHKSRGYVTDQIVEDYLLSKGGTLSSESAIRSLLSKKIFREEKINGVSTYFLTKRSLKLVELNNDELSTEQKEFVLLPSKEPLPDD